MKIDSHIDSLKKARQAQSDAFLCRLFYFAIKAFVVYLLYLYKSPLHTDLSLLICFSCILLLNSYLIMTIGQDPGFAKPLPEIQDQGMSFSLANDSQICELCHCKKLLRQKHCKRCQKCVYKFDHHCPWIGACVGEYNQGDFWWFLLMQTVQAIFAWFLVIYATRENYQYQQADHYSGQYGALTIFIIFMYLYIAFVGVLLVFHSYLIVMNLTTEEIMKSRKLQYMKTAQPFNNGPCINIKQTLLHNKQSPIEWKTRGPRQRPTETCWDNKYYSCC